MIRILTIDDEPLALQLLEAFIRREPDLELVASCSDAESSRQYLDKVDALFIDINMPGISGMEFVRGLENPPVIVFTTALSEYAIEGYKVNAVDYLLKPFSYEEFHQAVGRMKERLDFIGLRGHDRTNHRLLLFKTDCRSIQVESSDIVFIEGFGAYVKIHMASTPEALIVLYSLKRLSEELAELGFIRIHKSYIINIPHIKKAGKTSVTLSEGTILPVGDIYKEQYLSRIKITGL